MKSFAMKPLALFLAMVGASASFAGGPGSTGGVALKIPVGARPTAMGGAFTGLADDGNALFANPAGLATLSSPELLLAHAMYLAEINYEALGYIQPLQPLGTLGLGINMMNYGNLDRSLERADGMFGGLAGATNPQDLFVTAGWGSALPPFFGMERFRAGAALKRTFQQLTGGTVGGAGAVLGALWDTPAQGLRLGTMVDNLGGVATLGRMLPVTWVAGASLSAPMGPDFSAVYAADTRLAIDTTAVFSLGGELTAFNILILRGGWRGGGEVGGPSFGAGARTPLSWFRTKFMLKLDYAVASSGELGRSQRFQLTAMFGSFGSVIQGGSIRRDPDGGEAVLTWQGRGPAYEVYYRRPDEGEWTKLTDQAVTETNYPLMGLAPGRYIFRIVTVNPLRPDWRGPVSREIDLEITGNDESGRSTP